MNTLKTKLEKHYEVLRDGSYLDYEWGGPGKYYAFFSISGVNQGEVYEMPLSEMALLADYVAEALLDLRLQSSASGLKAGFNAQNLSAPNPSFEELSRVNGKIRQVAEFMGRDAVREHESLSYLAYQKS